MVKNASKFGGMLIFYIWEKNLKSCTPPKCISSPPPIRALSSLRKVQIATTGPTLVENMRLKSRGGVRVLTLPGKWGRRLSGGAGLASEIQLGFRVRV